MPQQLIYTSAPRGVVPGRSGYCTVSRSVAMREPLALRLEQLSYYHHLSLSGGQERPIFACRIVDIRGARFHVLSRIQDAGLDFTGRTNFIAHHFVATPEEIRQLPSPPLILRDWGGWLKSWTKEPQLLDKEDWSGLSALAGRSSVPAQTWQQVTGDAVNGYGLLEVKPGACFRVDGLAENVLLGLLAESLELLETRDNRKDFRNTAWQYTFTTSLQEQDNPADFRWRCVHADNPAAAKTGAGDCPPFASIRASRCTDEETVLARAGRQPPRFIIEPQDLRIREGETARLIAKAEGIPNPTCEWFSVDRANNGKLLAGETNPEMVISNPPLGVSRYIVRASNSTGEATSRTATVSVEQRLRLSQSKVATEPQRPIKRPDYQKSPEEIAQHRARLNAKQSQEKIEKGRAIAKASMTVIALLVIAVAGAFAVLTYKKWRPRIVQQPEIQPGKLTVGVRAEGNPPLFYQWYRNQKIIPSATNSSLDVGAAGFANSDTFFVTASNTWGSATSVTTTWLQPLSTSLPSTPMLQDNLKPLSAPWTYTNVGGSAFPNTPMTDNGTITIIGKGKNFSGTADEFLFASKGAPNPVDFTVRLSRISRGTNRCQCGIMLRETKQPDSSFVFFGISSTNVVWIQRATKGTNCVTTNVQALKLPIDLQLGRDADKFFGRVVSFADSNKWITIETSGISMSPTNYLLGFAMTTFGSGSEVAAEFEIITNK